MHLSLFFVSRIIIVNRLDIIEHILTLLFGLQNQVIKFIIK